MRFSVLIVTLLLASDKPTDEACKALCIRSGYDGGKMEGKGCVCFTSFPNYQLFLHNQIDLPDMSHIKNPEKD